jgi:hypothetical protein
LLHLGVILSPEPESSQCGQHSKLTHLLRSEPQLRKAPTEVEVKEAKTRSKSEQGNEVSGGPAVEAVSVGASHPEGHERGEAHCASRGS